jgi:hypothetical protein
VIDKILIQLVFFMAISMDLGLSAFSKEEALSVIFFL